MELAATWASLLFIPYLSPLLLPEDGDIYTLLQYFLVYLVVHTLFVYPTRIVSYWGQGHDKLLHLTVFCGITYVQNTQC